MRDFIDRLAARIVGGDSMLSPRLPSLFESPPAMATVPLEVAREVAQSTAHEAQPPTSTAMPAQSHAQARENAAARTIFKYVPAAVAESPRAPQVAFHGEAALAAPRASAKAAEPVEPPPANRAPSRGHREGEGRQAIVLRERLRDAQPVAGARPPADEGTLLAPVQSVFRTSPVSAAMPASPTAARPAHSASMPAGAREDVVHVSIGRLEVRATPAAGKEPSRRPNAPRASPLDDYLRQRGKASP